jgi:formate hydrogenlyase transcriptional activator
MAEMPYQLWALHSRGGQAIVRSDTKWYLLSIDNGWKPLELQDGRDALRWALFVPAVPASNRYPSLEVAAARVRDICLAELESPGTSFGDVSHLYKPDEVLIEQGFEEIAGQSKALHAVLHHVGMVAPTDSTVLICGETGTGKELMARAIHNLSRRHSNPFVKINCAAIPTDLLESELFGHEKGAFAGASVQRMGCFELADHGTMFLDEIGDLPLELQPKLLRVLQEREIQRLGSTRTKKVDVRVVAATHRALEEMVVEKRFRLDLYYRLNVFPVFIPPLRERPEDIPLLVRDFVQQFARRMGKMIVDIPAETMDALTRYAWPGNIRELQNVIERAVILSRGPILEVPIPGLMIRTIRYKGAGKHKTVEQAERAHILAALKETNGALSGRWGAATRLGMDPSTLLSHMLNLGIFAPDK